MVASLSGVVLAGVDHDGASKDAVLASQGYEVVGEVDVRYSVVVGVYVAEIAHVALSGVSVAVGCL